jgi:hypothetical protein
VLARASSGIVRFSGPRAAAIASRVDAGTCGRRSRLSQGRRGGTPATRHAVAAREKELQGGVVLSQFPHLYDPPHRRG